MFYWKIKLYRKKFKKKKLNAFFLLTFVEMTKILRSGYVSILQDHHNFQFILSLISELNPPKLHKLNENT